MDINIGMYIGVDINIGNWIGIGIGTDRAQTWAGPGRNLHTTVWRHVAGNTVAVHCRPAIVQCT